jgi:hypothetical protein
MANKRKPTSQKVRPTGVSLPPDLLKKAQRLAFQMDMSLSKLVRILLSEKLEATR